MKPDPPFAHGARRAVLLVAALALGCAGQSSAPSLPSTTPGSSAAAAPSASVAAARRGSVVLVGRILTMDEPSTAEAIYIEDGVVMAVGAREDVLSVARDGVPVVELGTNVAYPGFIDTHAHWIGDREYYGVQTPEEAIDLAVSRGWTSISEQWVNPERLDELTRLAADDALRLRVDAYLALNFNDEFFGEWYADREPGAVDDHLRVQGLKIHLDTGSGRIVNWEAAELTATIGRANEAGWQVSVHSMSSVAQELVLDAFEAALGAGGANPLHHRLEHVIQVSDAQLARMARLDLALVIHPDGEPDWIMYDGLVADFDRSDPPADIKAEVGRWRDFVDAGLHVSFATDAPWTFPDFEEGDRLVELTDAMGRPIDHLAAAMDGRQRMHPQMPAWLLDQLLTVEQGLRALTVDAAWALGDQARRGHLTVGTLGDVTVLSGDVLAATPDEIRAMDVIATIVGGVPVHCPASAICSQFRP